LTDHVRIDIDGAIAHIVLDRPERLNALTFGMLTDIEEACSRIEASDARCVILQGRGSSFCAGMDLDTFRTGPLLTADPDRRYDAASLGRRAADALASLSAVTIAAVHGHVVGGAVVLAAACDLLVAEWSTEFSIPEVDLGIPLAWGGVERLVPTIGAMRTKELVMTGRTFHAEEAASWGLVTRLVENGTVLASSENLAGVIAEKPRFPVTITKRHVAEVVAGDTSRDDALGLIAALEDDEAARHRDRHLDRGTH